MHTAEVICFYLLSFLLGGIPFGLLIAKWKKIDLKKIGSGNIGATNVYRALGLKYALLVFALDGLKGAVPVLLCEWIYGRGIMVGIAGVMPVLGHIISPYLRFRGGKGVATGFGAMVAISPLPALICLAIWISLMSLFKIASLASLISALALPVLIFIFKEEQWVLASAIVIVVLVILSHYSNIGRLLRGEEKKIK